jgi:hypothetical protein
MCKTNSRFIFQYFIPKNEQNIKKNLKKEKKKKRKGHSMLLNISRAQYKELNMLKGFARNIS